MSHHKSSSDNNDLDKWNPMTTDFNDTKFNSYDRGVGKKLAQNMDDKTQSFGLYVRGIPNEMTEDGLAGLFGQVGKVVRVKKVCSKQDTGCTFGFVTLSRMSDAAAAIQKFDGHQIGRFTLHVVPERSEAQKAANRQRGLPVAGATPDNGYHSHESKNASDQSDEGSKENEPGAYVPKAKANVSIPSSAAAGDSINNPLGALGSYEKQANKQNVGVGIPIPGLTAPVGTKMPSLMGPSGNGGIVEGQFDMIPSFRKGPNMKITVNEAAGRKVKGSNQIVDGASPQHQLPPINRSSDHSGHGRGHEGGRGQQHPHRGRGDYTNVYQGRDIHQSYNPQMYSNFDRGRGFHHHGNNIAGYVHFQQGYTNTFGRGRGFNQFDQGQYNSGYGSLNSYSGMYDQGHGHFNREQNFDQQMRPYGRGRGGYRGHNDRGRGYVRGFDGGYASGYNPNIPGYPPQEVVHSIGRGSYRKPPAQAGAAMQAAYLSDFADNLKQMLRVNLPPSSKSSPLSPELQTPPKDVSAGSDHSSLNDTISRGKPQVSLCSTCGNPGVMRCRRCKTPYCSRKCQEKDWSDHKRFCAQLSKENADLEAFEKQFDVSLDTSFLQAELSKPSSKPSSNVGSTASESSQKSPRTATTGRENSTPQDMKGTREHVNDKSQKGQEENLYSKNQSGEAFKGKDGSNTTSPQQKDTSNTNSQQREDASNANSPQQQVMSDVSANKSPQSRNNEKEVKQKIMVKQSSGVKAEQTNVAIKADQINVSELKWVTDELAIGQQITVMIIDAESPLMFVVHLRDSERTQAFSLFCDEMNQFYNKSQSLMTYQPDVGQLVVAKFADNNWYRAEVLSGMTDHKLMVLFLDFNNKEYVSAKDIRNCVEKFKLLPIHAVKCRLANLKSAQEDGSWPVNAMNLLAKKLRANVFTVSATITQNEKQLVTLDIVDEETNTRVSQSLIDAGFGVATDRVVNTPDSSSPAKPEINEKIMCIKTCNIRPIELSLTSLTIVQFVDVQLPAIMVVQKAAPDDAERIKALSEKINEFYSSRENVLGYSPEIGELCAAKYTDDQWYRANIVKGAENNIIEVSFVDYGNTDVVPIACVQKLDKQFADWPIQAVKLIIAGIEADQNKFLELANQISSSPFSVKVLKKDDFYTVEIYNDNSECLNKVFCPGYSLVTDLVGPLSSLPKTFDSVVKISDSSSQAKPEICKKIIPIKTCNIHPIELSLTGLSIVQFVDVQLPAVMVVQKATPEDTERIKALSDQINKFYSSQENVLNYSPEIGELCAAKYTDDQWYRANIVKGAENNTIEVSFVDYGNTDVVPITCVQKLDKQFADWPIQAVKLIIAGIEADQNKFLELANQISSSPFSVKVLKKDDLYTVEIYNDNSECLNKVFCPGYSPVTDLVGPLSSLPKTFDSVVKISDSSSQAKPEICEKIVPIKTCNIHPIELSLTGLSIVQFVDVQLPAVMVVQKATPEDTERIRALSDQINKFYSSQENVLNYSPEIGELCAAKYTDDQWYRANIVKGPENNTIEVSFVDYGNTDVVPITCVQKLDKQFADWPIQAVKLIIAGIEADQNKFLELANQISSSPFSVKVLKKDDLYTVEIYNDNSECLNKLVCPGYSPVTVPSLPEASPEYAYTLEKLDRASLAEKSQSVAVIVHAVNPGHFFCHVVDQDTQTRLESIDKILSEYCQTIGQTSYRPMVGHVCCAFCSEYACWFRAVVLQVNEGISSVQFFDYGSCENGVPVDKICPLPESLSVFPSLAVECSLTGIHPVSGHWDKPAVEVMKNLTETCVQLEIVSKRNHIHCVKVTDKGSGDSIGEKLITAGLAVPSSGGNLIYTKDLFKVELQSGAEIDAIIRDISESRLICIQHSSKAAQKKITNMQHELNGTVVGSESYQPTKGEFVICQSQCDDQWYRADVQDILNDGQILVQFVDYGNSELVHCHQIRKIKTKSTDLPIQGALCKVAGFDAMDKGEFASFAISVLDKPIKITVLSQEDKVYIVELRDIDGKNLLTGGQDAAVKLTSSSHSPSNVVEKMPPTEVHVRVTMDTIGQGVPSNDKVDSVILFVDDDGCFYCQVAQNEDVNEFRTMWIDLLTYCISTPADSTYQPEPGDVCCACDLAAGDDSAWYRAVVLSNPIGGKLGVRYIDFGNTKSITLNGIRRIKSEYCRVPALAVKCVLAGKNTIDALTILREKHASTSQVHLRNMRKQGDHYQVELVTLTTEVARVTLSGRERNTVRIICPNDAMELCFQKDTADSINVMQRLQELNDYYHDVNNISSPYMPAAEELICAKYSLDDSWYRANVDRILDDGTISVTFVDFGNSERVSLCDVRILHISFTTLPLQAIRCTMPGVDITKCGVEIFSKLMEPGFAKYAEVVNNENDTYQVKLYSENGHDINQLCLASTSKDNKIVTLDSIGCQQAPETEFQVLITFVENPASFYCQVYDMDLLCKLEALVGTIQAQCTSTPSSPEYRPVKDEVCCAFFQGDKTWHRAVIRQVDEQTVDVTYIDFGVKETLTFDQIHPIAEECCQLPALAFHCGLAGIESPHAGWSPDAIQAVRELAFDAKRAVLVSTDVNSQKLQIFVGEQKNVDIGQLLVSQGLAVKSSVGSAAGTGVGSALNMQDFLPENVLGGNVENKPLLEQRLADFATAYSAMSSALAEIQKMQDTG